MKTSKSHITKRIILSVVFLLTVGLSTTIAETPAKPSKSIVEIAVSNDNFSILVEALSKAELVDALSTEGPFTVFAPTNDAFEALFNQLGVNGVNDLSKDQLTPILLYHVVNGNIMATSVKSGEGMIATLNKDAQLTVNKSSEGVVLNNGSKVVATDIAATNGVIHVIDAVLVPVSEDRAKAEKGSCN